jgi:hypothetical protein
MNRATGTCTGIGRACVIASAYVIAPAPVGRAAWNFGANQLQKLRRAPWAIRCFMNTSKFGS